MDDEPVGSEAGDQRAGLWERLPQRVRHRLRGWGVFAVGLTIGGYVAATIAVSLVEDRPDEQSPPRLTAEVLALTRNDRTDALYVDLRVTNHSDRQVQVNRLLAQATGYVIIDSSPQPPAVGGALRIPPEESATVGLAVRGNCAPARTLPSLTVLAVLGDGIGPGQSVLVELSQQVNHRLSERRSAYCDQRANARREPGSV